MSGTLTLPIVSVVVHPDGALVHRRGRVPTDGVVVVGGLPLSLDVGSVRVEASGVELVDVAGDVDLGFEDRAARTADAGRLVDVADLVRRTSAELEGRRGERRLCAALKPAWAPAEDRNLHAAALDAWLAANDEQGVWAEALDQEIAALDESLRRAREEVALLRARLADAGDDAWIRRWLPTRRLVVRTSAGEAELTVSYRVSGATWSPSYLLEADPELVSGRFAMRALVLQATGESWDDVELTLSTASATRRVDVPELRALRLGARQPAPPPAWRELPVGLDALFPQLPANPVPVAAPAPPPAPRPPAASMEARPTQEKRKARRRAEPEDDESVELDALSDTAPPSAPRNAPPPPQAMPMASRSKAAGPMAIAGALASVLSRSADLGASGGAPPPAPSPMRASVAAAPPPPSGLDVEQDNLDYGRLRVGSFDAPAGRRGRLDPVDDADRLAERGMSPAAVARYRSVLDESRRRWWQAEHTPRPPLCVLPGPVHGSDVAVAAAGRASIPSDGQFHSIAVFVEPVSMSVSYVAVPRGDARVFRRVKAALQRTSPLVAGPVEVYVGGSLELVTPWEGASGVGAIELSLGAEDRLRLVRNVRYREESAGMFGGSRRLHTRVEVDVASSLGRPVRVELLERVPVPSDDGESVTVELVEHVPAAHAYEGEPDGAILKGGKRQLLEVPAGGVGHAVLAYSVTLGAKDELVGGDRRG